MIRRTVLHFIPGLIFSLLLGCHNAKQTTSFKHLTLQPTTIHKTLHFTGTIQPIHESTLTTPVDGVIEAMHAHYGQSVRRNAPIFTLNSTELQKHYNDVMTAYLKAKDSYTVARAKFVGTEELWNAGLLSKNNYLSEKSSLNTERITLMQSTRNVSELLEKIGQGNSADDELAGLSFSEFDKVHLALMSKHNLLELKAPIHGVLLYPPKSGDDKNTPITVGSAIKTGQVLALIGDMRGLRVDIDIPEVDIAYIKQNMPATIRGIAFNQYPLHGQIVAINAQASNKNNGVLPSFTAIVEVKHLSQAMQHLIKVGMSATIELITSSEDKLLVPIEAISQLHGQTWVMVETTKGHQQLRSVTTGMVEGDQVVIERGLRPGDTIIYE